MNHFELHVAMPKHTPVAKKFQCEKNEEDETRLLIIITLSRIVFSDVMLIILTQNAINVAFLVINNLLMFCLHYYYYYIHALYALHICNILKL